MNNEAQRREVWQNDPCLEDTYTWTIECEYQQKISSTFNV